MRIAIFIILSLFIFSCKDFNFFPKKVKTEENATPQKKITALIKFDNARIRENPNINANLVMKLVKGDVVELSKKTNKKEKVANYGENYWYEVITKEGKTGWIFGDLIEVEIPSVTVVNDVTDDKKDIEKTVLNTKSGWKNKKIGLVSTVHSIVNGVLYFGTKEGVFYALDSENGKDKWKYKTDGEIYDFIVLDESVYVNSEDGSIYCLNIKNGIKKWAYLKEGKSLSFITIYENFVFFSNADTIIYIDIKNGKKSGEIKLDSNITKFDIFENILYANLESGEIQSVKLKQ